MSLVNLALYSLIEIYWSPNEVALFNYQLVNLGVVWLVECLFFIRKGIADLSIKGFLLILDLQVTHMLVVKQVPATSFLKFVLYYFRVVSIVDKAVVNILVPKRFVLALVTK